MNIYVRSSFKLLRELKHITKTVEIQFTFKTRLTKLSCSLIILDIEKQKHKRNKESNNVQVYKRVRCSLRYLFFRVFLLICFVKFGLVF